MFLLGPSQSLISYWCHGRDGIRAGPDSLEFGFEFYAATNSASLRIFSWSRVHSAAVVSSLAPR